MWIAVIVIIAVFGVLALLMLLPRSEHDEDGPLPRDVETRLLLGEPPAEIERSLEPSLESSDDPAAPDG